MRTPDGDKGEGAPAPFVNTLLVRMDVGGPPAASLQGAHREAGVDGRRILPYERPAAEAFALALKRLRDREVRFAVPPNDVPARCQCRSCDRHPTGCSFFFATVSVSKAELFSTRLRG